jgi:hypothetical protein
MAGEYGSHYSSAVERMSCAGLDCVWVLASVVVFLCCSFFEERKGLGAGWWGGEGISAEEESVSVQSRCCFKS